MKSSWVKGTVILTASAFFVKLLSLIYKVPYQNIAGDEGLYVFQQVYPIIGIYMTLNSVVLPTIVSELLLTYQFSHDIKMYIRRSLWLVGVVSFGVLFLCSDLIAKMMGDGQLSYLIQTIGLIFLLMPGISYWRGVSQSKVETIQYAGYSTTFEQLFRVIAIIAALIVVGNKSVYHIAYWAYFGGLIGPVFALLFLMFSPLKDSTDSLFKLKHRPHFFKKSIYLFLSAGILILFQLIDSFFVFNSLVESGIQPLEAMVLKGSYDRGLPIIQCATVFTGAVVSAMVPQLALEHDEKKRKKVFNASLHTILLLAVPATVGLLLVINELNVFLFTNNNGIEAIKLLVLQVVLYPLIVFATAILQNQNQYAKLLTSILVGLTIKMILVGPLTVSYGIEGSALSSVVALITITCVQLIVFRKMFSQKMVSTFVQTALATLMMWVMIELATFAVPFITASVTDTRLVSLVVLMLKVGVGVLAYGSVIAMFVLIRKNLQSKRKRR